MTWLSILDVLKWIFVFKFAFCSILLVSENANIPPFFLPYRDSYIFPHETCHRDRAPGEDRVRGLLRRRHHLPGMLLYVPHRQLPLPIHREAILEARLLRHRLTHHGIFRPVAVLRLLLPL